MVDVPPALLARARDSVESSPDVRPDRIAEARQRFEARAVTSDAVAAKMIGRLLSDSLR